MCSQDNSPGRCRLAVRHTITISLLIVTARVHSRPAPSIQVKYKTTNQMTQNHISKWGIFVGFWLARVNGWTAWQREGRWDKAETQPKPMIFIALVLHVQKAMEEKPSTCQRARRLVLNGSLLLGNLKYTECFIWREKTLHWYAVLLKRTQS